jgi:hypothetical protein
MEARDKYPAPSGTTLATEAASLKNKKRNSLTSHELGEVAERRRAARITIRAQEFGNPYQHTAHRQSEELLRN